MRYVVTLVAYFDRVVEVEAENESEAVEMAENGDIVSVIRDWEYLDGIDATEVERGCATVDG